MSLERALHFNKVSNPLGPSPLKQLQLPRAAEELNREKKLLWTVMLMADNSSCHYKIIQIRGDNQVGLMVHLSFFDCKTTHFSI